MPKKRKQKARRIKKNKYCQEPKLPPTTFNKDYEIPRGWSGKTKQWIRIALSPKMPPKHPEQILYFCVILLRKLDGKWYDIVVFDTFHRNKNYVHGHRRIGISRKREDINNVPNFRNFKAGLFWVLAHFDKRWNKYVTIFYRDIKRMK